MEVIQTLTSIIFTVDTRTIFPKVRVDLEDGNIVKTHVDGHLLKHVLVGNVTWPGIVTFSENATFTLEFPKQYHEMWPKDFVKSVMCVVYCDPRYRRTDILEVTRLPAYISMFKVKFRDQIFVFPGVGRFMTIQHLDDRKRQDLRHRFTPIPDFSQPFEDRYPAINKPRSTDEPILFVARNSDKDHRGRWLEDVEAGDVFSLSNPAGTFHPDFYAQASTVYIFAAGVGISAFLSVIHDILQREVAEIRLLYAALTEKHFLFKKELDELNDAHDRMTIDYFVKDAAEKNYTGRVGIITRKVLREYFPMYRYENLTAPQDHRYLVCGGPTFALRITRRLTNERLYGIPRKHLKYIQ